MRKTYKCGFSHCMCNEPLTDDNAFIFNKRRWHKQCYHIKETVEKIREYYLSHIDRQVTMSFLNSVLNSILYEKKVDADYLLFALQYAWETGKEIKAPAYLHYLADDNRIKRLYKTTHMPTDKQRNVSIDTEFDYDDKEGIPLHTKSFSDIIKKE